MKNAKLPVILLLLIVALFITSMFVTAKEDRETPDWVSWLPKSATPKLNLNPSRWTLAKTPLTLNIGKSDKPFQQASFFLENGRGVEIKYEVPEDAKKDIDPKMHSQVIVITSEPQGKQKIIIKDRPSEKGGPIQILKVGGSLTLTPQPGPCTVRLE